MYLLTYASTVSPFISSDSHMVNKGGMGLMRVEWGSVKALTIMFFIMLVSVIGSVKKVKNIAYSINIYQTILITIL